MPLESKLKLGYQMILNVLKQEDENITDIIKLSFFENETEKQKDLAIVRKSQLE